MPKMNANAFLQKDYENETAYRPKKTNPNKANFERPFFLLKQAISSQKNFLCEEKTGGYPLFGHLLQPMKR
jgi:hypothetical protein